MKPSSETNVLTPQTRINVRDIAYIAGFIDGEGTISGTIASSGQLDIIVTAANTCKETLVWIQSKVGGMLYNHNRSNVKIRWKPGYIWRCSSINRIELLKRLIPHLKQKQKQAHKALAILGMIKTGQAKDRIERAIQQLQAMNKRGR